MLKDNMVTQRQIMQILIRLLNSMLFAKKKVLNVIVLIISHLSLRFKLLFFVIHFLNNVEFYLMKKKKS